MAEALGLAASIIAIVQLADRITSVCEFFIESIEGYPRDLQLILVETSSVRVLFQNLKFVREHDPEASVFLDKMTQTSAACLESVTQLEKLVPSSLLSKGNNKRKRKKTDLVLASLAWPLRERKVRSLLKDIASHKATISNIFCAEIMQDVKNIIRTLNSVSDRLTNAERNEICKWLQHINPSPNHNSAHTLYAAGTGDWMFCTSEWKDWASIRSRCLWVHGIPGAGKTVLASHLIEKINQLDTCDAEGDMPVATVYYYCYHARDQDETAPFLRWIISQLCRNSKKVPGKVHQLYSLSIEQRSQICSLH